MPFSIAVDSVRGLPVRDAFGLVDGNALVISPGEFSDTRVDATPSAVLVGDSETPLGLVTYWNQGERMAPFSALSK